jgi:autotransporter-associated beta strand protein
MKRKSIIQFSLHLRPVALVLAMGVGPLYGDSATWAGADGVWATLSNWTPLPAAEPGAADTATFSAGGYAGTGLAPINAGGTASVNNIVFDGTAQDYRLTGTINLSASGSITASNGIQTIASTYTETPVDSGIFVPTGASIVTAGSASFTNNGAGTLSLGIDSSVAGSTLTFGGSGPITLVSLLAAAANTTAVLKNDAGTLDLGNFNNSNVQGGFTITGGTVIFNQANGLSNRALTTSGGAIIRMLAGGQSTFNNANGVISIAGDTTFHYAAAATNWGIGSAAVGSTFSSTGAHTVTFMNTTPFINGIRITALNSGFSGTYKLGLNGSLTFNGQARGSSTSTLNMGDPQNIGESHYFSTGIQLHSQATQSITPIQFGALTGTDTAALMCGRQNNTTHTTGTQFEIGALNGNTTYAGNIRDGSTSAKLLLQSNGTPAGTAQTETSTHASSSYNRNNGVAGNQGTTELVKVGTGTLTLTGTNAHTGGTVIKGGAIAVGSDAALGATYDGSLRPFQLTLLDTDPTTNGDQGSVIYASTDLPNAVLTGGGTPTTAASINIFNTAAGATWAQGNLFMSFSDQDNDAAATVPVTAIVNNLNGLGYTSVPTVSFIDGTINTAGAAPVATVRVTGLLTLDGGTLKTDAGITSNRAVVLAAGGGTFDTNGFDSTLSGVVNGGGSLTKSGGGKLSLTGTNTHTGNTLVTAGVLAVNGTSISNTANLSITGGQVEVVANETVGSLTLGGVPQESGETYGAPGSGADNPSAFFTGTGVITVSGASAGYSGWASTNAPGQTADQDHDNDGVKNGVEYFMGQTGSGFTALPVPVNGKVTWTKDPTYSGTFMIQISDTLAADDWENVPVNVTNPKDNGTSVEYTLPTGQGKLFTRLQVTPN